MKHRKLVVFGAVLPFVVVWICTGGVVVHRYWVNPFNSYQRAFKPYVLAEVKPGDGSWGVPLLFQYCGDRTPFGIALTYITHNVVTNGRVIIEKATIRFPDGAETNIAERVQASLILRPEEHWYIDDAHVKQKQPSLRGQLTISNCVPSRTPFTFHLKGRMLSEGNLVEAFEADWSFTPEYETHVYTTWGWIAASGA